jgi:Membrane carboxypeptidase/penicillin-binding protein
MNKILKKIFMLVVSIGLLLGLSILSILWVFSNNLPDYKFLVNYKPPVSSKVYSGERELVSDFASEKRIFVPYNAIPAKVVRCLFVCRG